MLSDTRSALIAPAGDLPIALPKTLDEIKSVRGIDEQTEHGDHLTLFLTVDVEDAYFDRPILMSGDGIGRQFGVFGILDELDARGLRGTFFVNVYEKDRQPRGVVKEVVQEIAARGHEVGLHSHPSPVLDFYCRPLFRLSRSAQADVLRWGADLLDKWVGEPPTSFRAGGYALNDDTFAAFEEVGIAIDSSCFFPSPNNHFEHQTLNAVIVKGGVVEAPITTVLRANGDDGRLEHRKLDLDWLAVDQLMDALSILLRHEVAFATFMMHSFSFIEKLTRKPEEPPSSRALYKSDIHSDRYVEVYGSKPAMRKAFSVFLDRVVADTRIQTCTLRDALGQLRATKTQPDVVPVVSSGRAST